MIYDAFKAAVAGGVPEGARRHPRGRAIRRGASCATLRARGIITACPAEKSGQDEFDFEYGDDFASHIEEFNPTFCKVLVRYNPEGDEGLEPAPGRAIEAAVGLPAQRAAGCTCSSCWCPPMPAQLERLGGDKKAYDLQLRPALMVRAIHELQDAGVEADVWKIEGIDRQEDCRKVVARPAAAAATRSAASSWAAARTTRRCGSG